MLRKGDIFSFEKQLGAWCPWDEEQKRNVELYFIPPSDADFQDKRDFAMLIQPDEKFRVVQAYAGCFPVWSVIAENLFDGKKIFFQQGRPVEVDEEVDDWRLDQTYGDLFAMTPGNKLTLTPFRA